MTEASWVVEAVVVASESSDTANQDFATVCFQEGFFLWSTCWRFTYWETFVEMATIKINFYVDFNCFLLDPVTTDAHVSWRKQLSQGSAVTSLVLVITLSSLDDFKSLDSAVATKLLCSVLIRSWARPDMSWLMIDWPKQMCLISLPIYSLQAVCMTVNQWCIANCWHVNVALSHHVALVYSHYPN